MKSFCTHDTAQLPMRLSLGLQETIRLACKKDMEEGVLHRLGFTVWHIS